MKILRVAAVSCSFIIAIQSQQDGEGQAGCEQMSEGDHTQAGWTILESARPKGLMLT